MINKLQASDYKAILFDLGGVLLNLDYQRTEDAFKKLGINSQDFENLQYNQHSFINDYEIGAISSSRFINSILPFCNIGTSPNSLVSAWNAMILDFPVERIRWLKQFGKENRLFLLSNTNELHLQAVNRRLSAITSHNSLEPYFIQTFYSHEIGMRKPDTSTFLAISKIIGANPADILFIDDSQQHIEGAKSVGFKTFHLERQTEISLMF